jgi:actin-related protein
MEEEVQALVVDNGSGMCKAGKMKMKNNKKK